MNLKPQQSKWNLYQFPPAFVLGIHGCDESVGEAILSGQLPHLKKSQNDYDWLGEGIYFWESNPQRASDFAEERAGGGNNSKGTVRTPFVLGAVLNLGFCLDLSDSSALKEVRQSHSDLKALFEQDEVKMPTNSQNFRLRRLDCAVFDFVHLKRGAANPPLRAYDTVRATYQEGEPLYEGTDLKQQDHTQICVLNPLSILGYFRPIEI